MTFRNPERIRPNPLRERAFLIGLHLPPRASWDFEEALEELARLAVSAGADVVGTLRQRRDRPDPATLLGAGKVRELTAAVRERKADLVLFEHDLTPAQVRNLTQALGVKVLDRSDLILDIFAQRARTREGKLQVEAAQLHRLLSRLVGKGLELSRLGGGIGTRGPGESRLEADRRRIRDRLAILRERIRNVERHRALYRRRRRKAPVAVVSLVGYTNAGKSTLLNALSGSRVPAEDRLFSTLDPTSRRIALPGGGAFVLTDTVGFIRHIPPQLVAAFRATLGELHDADLLLHVIDVSHPGHEEQREVVQRFLQDLGLETKPRLEVYTKIDRLPPEAPLVSSGRLRSGDVAVSARTGRHLPLLLDGIRERLSGFGENAVEFLVPFDKLWVLADLRREGRVLRETARPDGLRVRLRLDAATATRLRRTLERESFPGPRAFDTGLPDH